MFAAFNAASHGARRFRCSPVPDLSDGGNMRSSAMLRTLARACNSVFASPTSLPADGTTSDVTAQATTPDGTIGKGEVTFQVTNGSLNGGGSQASGTLANGQFSVKWACDEAKSAGCRGTQTLTANWNDRSAQVKVTFTEGGAVGDGGADAAPVVDAGSDGSTGGGALTITS